jgi:NADPH-dependent curcumin reductase CurA
MPVNRQFVLDNRPTGMPDESTFKLVEAPVPELKDGEMLVETTYLSVDPYMRGRISKARSYAKPLEIGEVMVGAAVGRVVESRNPKFSAGDEVQGMFGWQSHPVSNGSGVRKLDPSLPATAALGVLGGPGLTAYFGVLDICEPKEGETMVVSGAAGAVGSCAGQIGRIKGARVVGIAGTDEKVEHLTGKLGFDAAYNYKKVESHYDKLKELCPAGIDSYFDNVGGPITDAVLMQLNVHARVCVCGQISQYNNAKPEMGPRLLSTLIVARAKVQGMLVTDYMARFPEAIGALTEWVKAGKIQYDETVVDGFENTPRAFIDMLNGANTGKMLVRAAG